MGAVKHPIAQIQEAVDGIFTYEQAEKLKIIRGHMDSLERHKAELESLILEIAQNYLPQIELLLTVPGIHDAFTAIRILAEIGADMTVFDTSKHLCSWAGLTPQNAESAGKKKTTRIGKSGAYLKPLLIQVALAASRGEKHPEIYGKKQALQKRRGKKKAIVAIARRLLTAIYHILSKNEPYNPAAYTSRKTRILWPARSPKRKPSRCLLEWALLFQTLLRCPRQDSQPSSFFDRLTDGLLCCAPF